MKNSKKRKKQMMAWLLVFAMCFVLPFQVVEITQAEAVDTMDGERVPGNPVIAAEDGKITWDCVYFGNYWQSKYITQPGNNPEGGEDDVVHTDTDGTKYIVREDGSCYRFEPIKWRVLSVSEDGTDAFLMSDNNLDIQPYNEIQDDNVTWENSSIRAWLNDTFLGTAFTTEEQSAIVETEIENKKNAYAAEMEDGAVTTDKVYLLSLEEAMTRAYGFTTDLRETETRITTNTDFVTSGGTAKAEYAFASYWFRTLGTSKECAAGADGVYGDIGFSSAVSDTDKSVRPVLHLDLTQTDLWTYAGQVKQDKTEISPSATPILPTPSPTAQPGVTMAPDQIYPENPVFNGTDLTKNTWDCIYFGKYYNTKFTPSVLSPAKDHDTLQKEGEENSYLVRHEQGYFQYEPIKWRVLSINEDGTDAFLMADQVLDVHPYYSDASVEITWEKSDIRQWLNQDFLATAFTSEEQDCIKDSKIVTEDNRWSGQPGGNNTTDKVYLLSIEEALDTSYGFSSDETEGDTRRIQVTDYATAQEQLDWVCRDASVCWLRSPGAEKGYPATVGFWGDGEISSELSVLSNNSTAGLGVRPVMHVDLSDTELWTYAGKVTPKGIVTASEETLSPSPEENVEPQVKKPGKPVIKKLNNKLGKKVTLTLTKKVSGATGYQVAYATKSSMKGKKTKTFQGTSTTVKGLKKKTKYYFCVRAYAMGNGSTVYGKWSKVESIKIKK